MVDLIDEMTNHLPLKNEQKIVWGNSRGYVEIKSYHKNSFIVGLCYGVVIDAI